MNWKRVAGILYPVLIWMTIPILFILTSNTQKTHAGVIRRAELSIEHPLTIRLAIGRTTAVTFPVRPEKVVAGSPQAVEINFLNRDLTIRPLDTKPGNLIVYTKSSRYVILFLLASESSYDDAVVVNSFTSGSHPLRLNADSFVVEDIRVREAGSKSTSTISALISNEDRVLESESFPDALKCRSCIMRRDSSRSRLVCLKAVSTLECQTHGKRITLERMR